MTTPSVGIYGVGVYLPGQIRTNEWWPEELVSAWKKDAARSVASGSAAGTEGAPPGIRLAMEGLRKYAPDPFHGARTRHVLEADRLPSEMEVRAAQDALARSGTSPGEIDLLLVHSQFTDYLSVPNAPIIHRQLELPTRCMSLALDSAQNSWAHQLEFAQALIQTNRAKRALLIQSSSFSRVLRPEDEISPWFGDGATACVVGPVSSSRGLLAMSHLTDGAYPEALVVGRPGQHWLKAPDPYLHVADPEQARGMFLTLPSFAADVVLRSLVDAGVSPEEVDVYVSHQANAWMQEVTRTHLGLSRAKTFSSFPVVGSLSAANVPYCLAMAERTGALKDDDLVASFLGGCGATASGVAMRWGR